MKKPKGSSSPATANVPLSIPAVPLSIPTPVATPLQQQSGSNMMALAAAHQAAMGAQFQQAMQSYAVHRNEDGDHDDDFDGDSDGEDDDIDDDGSE